MTKHLLMTLPLALLAMNVRLNGQSEMHHAKGTFDVKVAPATTQYTTRMLLDKQYHGDLEASAKGEMLTAMTDIRDSAVYVAIETVTGKLHGKEGSFALHHTGIMNRGAQSLTVNVVPDSGTGGFAGISGKLTITITEGKHFYDLEYSLPEKP